MEKSLGDEIEQWLAGRANTVIEKANGPENCNCCSRCAAVERELAEQEELRQLGHRIIFDTKTGWSTNIWGVYCDPSKLDEHGYQVRL